MAYHDVDLVLRHSLNPEDVQTMSVEDSAEAEELAIWQIPPSALAFQCARPEAKQLAADLAAAFEDAP